MDVIKQRLVASLIATLLWGFACSASLAETATEEPTTAESAPRVKNSPLATEGPKPRPITPATLEEIQTSINLGADFLLKDQRPDGSWGSAENTKGLNIYAPVPGAHHAFRAAVTGLVISALVDSESTFKAGRKEQVSTAIERGQKWMLDHVDKVRRATPEAIYNTWGHAYSMQGLVRLHRRAEGNPELQARLKQATQIQADKLRRYSFVNGGWGYYDFDLHTQTPAGSPNSFTTATGLVSLYEAEQIGVTYPQRLIDKAITSVKRQRNPDFTYAYGEYLMMKPRYSINRPGGSLGRSQACNLALRLYDDQRVTDGVLSTWLNRLYARNGWLDIGRKRPIPHESHFAVAGYFFYYGHYYAAMTIELLPTAEQQYHQEHLAHILLPLQERDGSWWDYPFYNYHQQYGTAMAMFSLRRCLYGNPVPAIASPSVEAADGPSNDVAAR